MDPNSGILFQGSGKGIQETAEGMQPQDQGNRKGIAEIDLPTSKTSFIGQCKQNLSYVIFTFFVNSQSKIRANIINRTKMLF